VTTVRPAHADDAAAIANSHLRAWQGGYAHILPAGFLAALDPVVWTERRTGWLARAGENEKTLVATADGDPGTIVGHISMGPARDTGAEPDPVVSEIYSIYVDPVHWSTGAGRALIAAGVEWLGGRGAREIRIWVFAGNDRARRFYERSGFVADGAAEHYTADPGGPYETVALEVRYVRQLR
jgi:GNAT superfamily N-acetyltransferase